MTKILVVEDDAQLAEGLQEFLAREGFVVDIAEGEKQAAGILREGADLVLADISLHSGNGYEVCRTAQAKGIPVIFLTASGDENSEVKGFAVGGDDYIVKPYHPRVLISRINNVLRRHGRAQTIRIGTLTVDTARAQVYKNGDELPLSALEYRLLLIFVNNRGRLLSRDRLLEEIYDAGGEFVNDNTLTVYIKRLREKIEEDPQNPLLIRTVRGMGYRMAES
ncbi:MAG: response regulator transcription factor [Solobacterium sp.]|nr:response regulator transcription factor [Solobacterium sp.]